jgi:hypothetical protein
MEQIQEMGDQQQESEPVDPCVIFQCENWALFSSKKMKIRWPQIEDQLFILHTPCTERAEKEDFGQCFPMYHGNLWESCPFCRVETSSNVRTKLWKVYEFIRPKQEAKVGNP